MRKFGVIGLLTAIVIAQSVSAQSSLMLGVQGGIADITDDQAAQYNVGFNAGLHGFLFLSPYLGLGLQARYDRTTPDEDTFVERVGAATDAAVDGSLHMFEFLPTIRLGTAAEFSFINLFAQAGVGLGVFMERIDIDDNAIVLEDETETGLVISAGPGIAIGSIDFVTLEILPEYHISFPSDNTSDFYTIKGAISLRLPML